MNEPKILFSDKNNIGKGCAAIAMLIFITIYFNVNDKPKQDISEPKNEIDSRYQHVPQIKPRQKIIKKEKQSVYCGSFIYCVESSLYSSGPLLHMPNAQWLILFMSYKNVSNAPMSIPQMMLVDKDLFEYESSSETIRFNNAIDYFTNINPGVTKTGRIAFDVMPNKKYWLKIIGDYDYDDPVYIELKPVPAK